MIPETSNQMDLSVGFPLKNREMSELTESVAEIPNTRSKMPTAKTTKANKRVIGLLLNRNRRFDASADYPMDSNLDGSANTPSTTGIEGHSSPPRGRSPWPPGVTRMP
jgi:hypothetical protein